MINILISLIIFLQPENGADSKFLPKINNTKQFQDSSNMRCLGNYPYAGGRAIAIDSNAVFVSSGTAILIYARENPQSPIGNIITRHFVKSLFRHSQYLYILSGEFSDTSTNFIIYDVAQPSIPMLICEYRINAVCKDLYVRGQYAYVTAIYLGNLGGLRIFNISNPAAPFQVSYLPLPGVGAIDISGNYAYLVGDGFHIINISNPQAPTQVSYWSKPESLYTVGDKNIKCVGNTLYLSASITSEDEEKGALLTFNVTNPSNPALIGYRAFDVEVFNSDCLSIEDTFAYISYSRCLMVVNVRNPAMPFESGRYELWTGTIRQNVALNRIVYVAADNSYLKINFSNPPSPTLMFRYDTEFPGLIGDICVKNNYAFSVTSAFPLLVFNISNPSQPTSCFIYRDSTIRNYTLYAMYLVDTMLYVAGAYFYAFNISNPLNPICVARFVLPFFSAKFIVRGNYAYFAGRAWGFVIYDISNLNNPVLVGRVETPAGGDFWGIEVIGNRAYIAGYSMQGTFYIIDISNHQAPYLLSSYSIVDQWAYTVTVRGDTAYVGLDSDILILDCRNPYSPSLINRYSLSRQRGSDIILIGNRLYLGWGYSGCYILDVSNPNTPNIIGYYNTAGFADNIYVANGLIHTANVEGGYDILQYYGAGVEEKGSEKVKRRFGLKLHPKPTNKSSLIEYGVTKNSMVTLDLLDSLGRVRKTIKKEKMKPGNYQINLNTSNLSPGVYLIRLKQDTEQAVEKLVIVN